MTTPATTSPSPERKPRSSKNSNNTPRNSKQPSTAPQLDTSSSDALSQTIASQASAALMHPQVTLTVYIPTTCVGAVIGRRGSTILQIQKQAQQSPHATGGPVRLSIVGHEEKDESAPPFTYSELDWSCKEWTPVVIRADPNAALHAAYQLQKLTEDNIDDVVLDLPISRTRHAALVGKRGVILQSLSADTHVRIMVPRKDKRHDVVQLEGELRKVQICLARVLVLAAESGSHNKKSNNNKAQVAPAAAAAAIQQQDYALSENITVATLPPQTKLRQIGRKTDTATKRKKENDEWILTVMGNSDDDIQAAIVLINKFLEAERPRRSRKPTRGRNNKGRGSGGGGSNNSNTAAPAEPSSS